MISSPIAGLLGLVAALGAALPASAQEGLPPVKVSDREAMDPEIASLIAEYVAKVEAAPADGDAHSELGLVYEANTLFQPAARCYENALQLMPDRKEWFYRLGLMQHASGALDEALVSMRKAAEALKNTPVIQARYGQLLFESGLIGESADAWERAIAAEANQPQPIVWPESRVGLAQLRMEQERYEDAVTLLQEALATDPTYRHAHYLLGLCYVELGKDAEAEIELHRGVNAWPRFPGDPHQPRLSEFSVGFHRRMMGIENMLRAGDAVSANTALQEVLQKEPDNHFALNLLARAYSMTGDIDTAVATLRKSDAANPGMCSTKIELTIALMNQLNQRQAQFQAAPVTDPEELQVVQGQMQALMEEILASARAAAELAPTLGRARYYHGLALFMRVNPQQPDNQTLQSAVNEMSMALTLGCQEPQLFEYLARGYQMLGQGKQMVAFAEANASNYPDQPGAFLFLANVRFMVDDRAGALSSVERALQLAPDNPQVTSFADQLKAAIEQRNQADQAQPGPQPEKDGSGGLNR